MRLRFLFLFITFIGGLLSDAALGNPEIEHVIQSKDAKFTLRPARPRSNMRKVKRQAAFQQLFAEVDVKPSTLTSPVPDAVESFDDDPLSKPCVHPEIVPTPKPSLKPDETIPADSDIGSNEERLICDSIVSPVADDDRLSTVSTITGPDLDPVNDCLPVTSSSDEDDSSVASDSKNDSDQLCDVDAWRRQERKDHVRGRPVLLRLASPDDLDDHSLCNLIGSPVTDDDVDDRLSTISTITETDLDPVDDCLLVITSPRNDDVSIASNANGDSDKQGDARRRQDRKDNVRGRRVVQHMATPDDLDDACTSDEAVVIESRSPVTPPSNDAQLSTEPPTPKAPPSPPPSVKSEPLSPSPTPSDVRPTTAPDGVPDPQKKRDKIGAVLDKFKHRRAGDDSNPSRGLTPLIIVGIVAGVVLVLLACMLVNRCRQCFRLQRSASRVRDARRRSVNVAF